MQFRWKETRPQPIKPPVKNRRKITLGADAEDLMSRDAYTRTKRGGIRQIKWEKR